MNHKKIVPGDISSLWETDETITWAFPEAEVQDIKLMSYKIPVLQKKLRLTKCSDHLSWSCGDQGSKNSHWKKAKFETDRTSASITIWH